MFLRNTRAPSRLAALTAAAALSLGGATVPAAAHSTSDFVDDDGPQVALSGQVLTLADAPAGMADRLLFEAGGRTLTLADSPELAGVESGDTISAVAEVPAEAVAGLDRGDAATVAAGVARAASLPVPGESAAGEILLDAADSAGEPLDLGAVRVEVGGAAGGGSAAASGASTSASGGSTAASRSSASTRRTAEAGLSHRVYVAFLSVDGLGKFWTAAQTEAYIGAVSKFWSRETRGAVADFTVDYASAQAAQSTLQCGDDFEALADQAAGLFGRSLWSFAYGTAEHLLIVSPTAERGSTACPTTYSGIGTLGSHGLRSSGVVHTVVPTGYVPGTAMTEHTITHEFGHNLSLGHASTATCPAGVVDGPFTGPAPVCAIQSITEQYSDHFNIMGRGFLNYSLNGVQKATLGLIAEGAGLQTVSKSYRQRFELYPTNTRGAESLQALLVEDRAANGTKKYSVDYDTEAGGVTIRRVRSAGDPDALPGDGTAQTFILSSAEQTTPTTDKVFKAGQRFVSQTGDVTINVIRASGATAEVEVTAGYPTATVSLAPSSWAVPAGGGTVEVKVASTVPALTVATSAAWLDVRPAAGASGRSFSITVGANPSSTAARTGTVTVSGDGAQATFAVSQSPVSDGGPSETNPSGPAAEPAPPTTEPPGQGSGGTGIVGDNPGGGGQVDVPTVGGISAAVKRIRLVKGSSVKVPVLLSGLDPAASGAVKVTWRSSRPKVASVKRATASGRVALALGRPATLRLTAAKPGQSTITLTAPGGKRLQLKVTVVAKAVAATKVTVKASTRTLAVGASAQLAAAIRPAQATGAVPTWRSSNPAVVRVDATGRVTAVASGRAKITVKVKGRTATTTLRVR
jgi:hypothetical protein